MSKRYLVLADGTCFEGEAFGAECGAVGELVFHTGVVGYLETLTDPCCHGQIVVQTFPAVGNYGVIPEDLKGKCRVSGYVVREWCDAPSNFRCQGDLDRFLREQGVPGICGVDTRQITRKLRDEGVMNAMICDKKPEDLDIVKQFTITGALEAVCDKTTAVLPAEGVVRHKVALLDLGCAAPLAKELTARGCGVTILPFDTTVDQILAGSYDGVALSDGPGDPAENTALIAEIAKLLGKKPLLAVGLGHQLTALAAGGRNGKLKYGHRGANQPVRDLALGRTFITSQNHGYAVEALPAGAVLLLENANDGTCEGLEYPEKQALTLQFCPETCPGPMNTGFYFDRFITLMGGASNAAE